MKVIELKLDMPLSLTENDVKLLLALKLFETGKLTLGQAAKLAEFSKQGFIDVLGQNHIPVINYSPEELGEEISH
jgi:predicted HTH domain antitoxin